MISSSIRRRLGLGIATLAIAGTTVTGTAYAAGSGASVQGAGACPKGYLCVWGGENFTGRMQKVAKDNPDLTRFGGPFAGTIRSYFNNGKSCDVQVFGGKNYSGASVIYKRGEKAGHPHPGSIHSNRWVNCR
ncbi:peptidase inhibitor family I36 protein [Streptomyces caatingaensis]|uniref:Peptidase inhibitor n=1 Tax=Streptomyces caatingaensis TaxID=1678637 RepID=A0A0K9XFK9_9ACTN|nr:peptidase inhibitor family I36 protein [Streptomyces caatingaensis]KNB51866.1 hypothetical protein AC230_16315 [Streptomyces caatingaensis]